MVVESGGQPLLRTFPGKVEASQRVELAFQVPGLIVNLPVKEGDRVAKGEVVAQLRPDDFQARLQALQGQLDQARAALRALRAGERVEERMRGARKQVEKRFDSVWGAVDDRVTDVLHRMGVPTRDEIQRLTRRVEELNAKIDKARGKPASAAT